VPKPNKDRIGLLIVRAFVEETPGRRVLVELLEVNAPDRVLGIVDSSHAAARLVGEWLDSLESTNGAPLPSVDGDR